MENRVFRTLTFCGAIAALLPTEPLPRLYQMVLAFVSRGAKENQLTLLFSRNTFCTSVLFLDREDNLPSNLLDAEAYESGGFSYPTTAIPASFSGG